MPAPAMIPAVAPASERTLVRLIAAVQFVNILDFVMVMPMGPVFSTELGFPASEIGFIAGAYTLTAGVVGFAGSFFLDRFDRKKALVLSLIGLALGTAAGALATGFASLLAARCLAGAFGGPATSIALSIISDVVPAERRGRAMGTIMGAFGAASVIGIPLGLVLGQNVSWRLPFFAVAGLGAIIVVVAATRLPALRGHLDGERTPTSLFGLLRQPLVRRSYLLTAVLMVSGFAVIPNIAAYLQYNRGMPESFLPLMYLLGGVISFFLTPRAGVLVDRHGCTRIGTIGTLAFVVVVAATFAVTLPGPPMAYALCFFAAMSFRNVSHTTLTSKVPEPAYRARFQSLQSAVQHLASAAGGFVSSLLLTSDARGHLIGMRHVAFVAMAIALLQPILLKIVEDGVGRRAAA